jgi:hypothetical protein
MIRVVLSCDGCGLVLAAEEAGAIGFRKAVERLRLAAMRNRWTSRRSGQGGENYCPDCKPAARRGGPGPSGGS